MKTRIVTLACLLALCWGATPAPGDSFGSRPLAFEANRGQTDERVKFLARGPGYTVFLTGNEAILVSSARRQERAVVTMTLAGADPAPHIVAGMELPGRVNYFRGGAPTGQVADVPTYASVKYVGVYPGVDLVYYGRERQLEYDFIVAPGANPEVIALAFDGASRVAVDERGDLVLHTSAGELRMRQPALYQEVDGVRRGIPGRYVKKAEGRIGFDVGPYDDGRPLVIDPLIVYSTYLGGTGDDDVSEIALDSQGNIYLTGTTTSADFPTTAGADEPTAPGGPRDAFVTKLSPAGALLYSTYLGTECDDLGVGIAVDQAGNAYVTGRARAGVCYSPGRGVLVAKLGPTGAGIYFFTFGGGLSDATRGIAIAVDTSGHAYVGGAVDQVDFPTTPGAFQTAFGGGLTDGFVAKVNPAGTGLEYSTYLGGSGDDRVRGLAIDAAGNTYVAGQTDSRDFPTRNPYQDAHHGQYPFDLNAFIAKLNPAGSALVYSTYLGGSAHTTANSLDVDGGGNAYVTGYTIARDFPTTPGTLQPTPGWGSHAFVTKLDATGADLVYSTYLYGGGDDIGIDIKVDGGGHAYVVGETNSLYFPIVKAFQPKTGRVDDGRDGFVAKLDPAGSALLYSSYLGGGDVHGNYLEGWDTAYGVAVDAAGNAYVVGQTLSFNFPVTGDAVDGSLDAGTCGVVSQCGDGFVTKIAAGGPGATPAVRVSATPAAVPAGGTITASWAGLPAPTSSDRIHLNTLGGGSLSFEELAAWSTGGTAGGTMSVALPGTLEPGWYELRLLTLEDGVLTIVGRSEPFRVGAVAASVDLVISAVASTPAQPTAGQPVDVAVTVANQGTAAAGAFSVDIYEHRATSPPPGTPGDVQCPIAGLAPGAAVACTRTVTYAAAGSFSLWAQVDTAQTIPEANEGNNVFGPRSITVAAAAPGPADLVVVAVSNPPAGALPGGRFSVSDTVSKRGAVTAAPSSTRYYLSLDVTKNAGDTLLTGLRAVPALAHTAESLGSVFVTIPVAIPPAIYRLLACADDTALVAEGNEGNNCLAAAGSIIVGLPDLVVTAVSNPPAAARPGTSFTVTDTILNDSPVATGKSSTTRYYLSLDGAKSATDKLLTGSRTVPILVGSAQFPGSAKAVTIPTTTPPGSYFLLACADDAKVIGEGNETNNCLASATLVTVALPDLSMTMVSNPGGPFPRGASFTVSDTVVNDAPVDTGKASTTRYYLSLNGTKDTADRLLTGSRAVPILGPASERFGLVTVTIPATTVPGAYILFACADDLRAVLEVSEANNCRASGTAIVVTP